MSNHVFKLPSGVECEVKELTGKHQRLLTEQKNKDFNKSLDEVLSDLVVRIGSVQNPGTEMLKRLLSADRKKILVEIRQYSLDFEPVFKFRWEYVTKDGQKANHDLEIDLSGGFPVKPLLIPHKEVGGVKWVEADYTEYEDIVRDMSLILPKSGTEVHWKLLDGVGEAIGSNTPKNQRSSHTQLKMRQPVELYAAKTDTVPIQLDLDKLGLKDIEALRAEIKRVEAEVDTIITFEHPEAESKAPSEKNVFVDVLAVQAFFFPSEAI